MPANTYGRQVVEALTNKSGGSVAAGDVVIIDTSNNDAFTTTTTGAFTGVVGVAQETIASNAVGRVATAGYVALVNVNASVTRGNFGKTHTVAKQATDAGSSRVSGSFCQFLTGGTTPDAHLFGAPDAGVASSISHTTLGTTSVGGSFETRGQKLKKITLATAGLLTCVNAHMKGDGTNNNTIAGLLYSDSGGSPTNILSMAGNVRGGGPNTLWDFRMNTTARWLTFPMGVWLAAGDYWIGVYFEESGGGATSIAYSSGTGSDRTVAGGTNGLPFDSSLQAISTGTNDYSIYADIIR